jgi:lysophospholipase L1-like esterase
MAVRGRARRIGYALLTTALVLTCGEAALRMALPDPRVIEQAEGRRVLAFGYDPLAPVTVSDAEGRVGFARKPPNLRPQVWSSRTSPGTYRVIVVGDSTVYGQLAEALAAGLRVPGRKVEVLNYGMPGAASDRVRILWMDALRQDPDLLLLYVGHNEWLEAAINPMSTRPFAVRSLQSRLRYSGLGRGVGRLLGRDVHVMPETWSSKEKEDAVAFPPWPEVAHRFRANLDAMCGAASGRSFAFVEQVSNLLAPGNMPPGVDVDGRIMRQLTRGFKALYEGDLVKADEDAWAVVSAHPDVGPGWVLAGRVGAARGERRVALEHVRRGRELDPARDRATAGHRQVVAEAAGACGATYVPTEDALYDRPDAFDVSRPLFLDPVHPSARGYVALAGLIVSGLRARGVVPRDTIFDDSIRLPEYADPLARGWNILPDITSPLSPTYNPHALPPLHGGPKGGKNPPPPSPAPPAPR